MVILKKLRSATLIEALVATVLIVVVFMVASMILNNMLLNSFSGNTQGIETKMAKLEYSAQHGKINLPYNDTYNKWEIQIEKESSGDKVWLKLTAINKDSRKEINKNRLWKAGN